MISHGTISLYTAALLSFLRKIKIEYLDENENLISKNIPIMYSSKEKAKSLEFFNQKDFISGNVNLLPRGTLSLVTIMKREDALLNRNIKINKVILGKKFLRWDFDFNSCGCFDKNLLNFVNNRAHDYQVVGSFNNFTSTYSFTNENIL